MPFIDARLGVTLDESQKDSLQRSLSEAVSSAFSKPESYIMTEIRDNCSLYMGQKSIANGAFISISLLGNASKNSCAVLTEAICNTLSQNYNIESSKIYVTYHPVDLWGWNGRMF